MRDDLGEPPRERPDSQIRPAVIYLAKSTTDFHGSLDTQLADCQKLCSRDGLTVVGEFQDEGHSAYSGNRGPDLAAAKQCAVTAATEHGRCDLVVQHSDRIARGDGITADHLGELFFWSRRNNIRLRSWQDDTNFDDISRAVSIGERNYEDSRRKSLAVRSGMQRRAEKGKANGGPAPYGYRYADGDLVVARAEAVIAAMIYALAASGMSQHKIQRRLNAEGIPVRNGKCWYQGTIAKILSNPIYMGSIRFHGEELPGTHEPLVSIEVWEEVARLRAMRARTKGRGRGRNSVGGHLLQHGLARCGVCGDGEEALIPRSIRPRSKTGKPYAVYICHKRIRDGVAACSLPPVPREHLDLSITRHLSGLVFDVDTVRRTVTETFDRQITETRAMLDQAQRALAQNESARRRVERDYLGGDLTGAQYKNLDEKLESDLPGLTAERDRLTARERELRDGLELRDIEQETWRRLADIQRALVGRVHKAWIENSDGERQLLRQTAPPTEPVDQVRAALTQVFDSFVVRHDPLHEIPQDAMKPWCGERGEFVVEPRIRRDVAVALPPPIVNGVVPGETMNTTDGRSITRS